jgi:hypothetical protein
MFDGSCRRLLPGVPLVDKSDLDAFVGLNLNGLGDASDLHAGRQRLLA